jgi:hypothetical protein
LELIVGSTQLDQHAIDILPEEEIKSD